MIRSKFFPLLEDLSNPKSVSSVVPIRRRKTPISTRKHASSRSRKFTAAMLNLRNGANYVVRPRSPRSSFSDRSSDNMETINRCDRSTIFVSDRNDRSDHMETGLNIHYLCHALLFQCIFAGGYSRLQSLLTIRRLIVSKQM